MFAGKFNLRKHQLPVVFKSTEPGSAMAERQNNKSTGKFYEHSRCECGGYGPREFSTSNCTGSVEMYGVWKAKKIYSGCLKCWSMEFHILTE